LVRHAKAEPGSPDAERALAARGIADATTLGDWLSAQGVVPDRAVLSPSRRTRQTWQYAAPPNAPEPELDERIYENTVDDLRAIIRETPDDVQTLVLVGHNPSMGTLAHSFDATIRAYPTGAAAIFEVASWDAPGTLIALTVPRG
jgi:phosphohistidine phosphatase